MLIILCENNSERYHFNILRTINIIYHIYIESKSYQLAYGRGRNIYLQEEISNKTKVNWDDHNYFTKDVIVQYLFLCIKL